MENRALGTSNERVLRMNREYYQWHSKYLDRNMELLIFGQSGARVLVFPTRVGRYFDFENWRLVDALGDHIRNGWVQLFCVDSIDGESWYNDWADPRGRVERHLNYERYIIEEVLPLTRYKNPDMSMIALGCSFGAFHAMNIALRHPKHFGRVIALSGRYDVTLNVDDFRNLMDGYYDEDVYLNNPSHFLPNADGDYLAQLRELEVTIAVGEHDPFVHNNHEFSEILGNKGIPHRLDIWPGRAHRARFWRQMLPHYV